MSTRRGSWLPSSRAAGAGPLLPAWAVFRLLLGQGSPREQLRDSVSLQPQGGPHPPIPLGRVSPVRPRARVSVRDGSGRARASTLSRTQTLVLECEPRRRLLSGERRHLRARVRASSFPLLRRRGRRGRGSPASQRVVMGEEGAIEPSQQLGSLAMVLPAARGCAVPGPVVDLFGVGIPARLCMLWPPLAICHPLWY